MRSFDVVALIHDDESLAEKIQEDRPEIMAQIRFGIEEELAYTLRDIFIRRTQLFFRAGDQGLGAIDRVATYMKKNLDWDDIRVEKEKEEYRTEVDRSRSWQKE
jgi:glycerol-3-phosphate dehydrogenase